MKKIFIIFSIMCLAGIFSAKAQGTGDTAAVSNLQVRPINISTLPVTVNDTIRTSDTVIDGSDFNGRRGKVYSIDVTGSTLFTFTMRTSWDSYLYLLDSNYRIIATDDDGMGSSSLGSILAWQVNTGRYYIVAAQFSYSYTGAYTLTVDTLNQFNTYTFATLPYRVLTSDTVQDTISKSQILTDHRFYNNIMLAKGYTLNTQSNEYVNFTFDNDLISPNIVFLDSNYNIINTNYRSILSEGGIYHIVIYERLGYAERPYRMYLKRSITTPSNALTYVNLPLDTTILDTLTVNDQIWKDKLLLRRDYKPSYVKAYRVQGTAGNILSINYDILTTITKRLYNPFFFLLDSNYQVLSANNQTLAYLTPNTGSYYVIVSGSEYSAWDTGSFTIRATSFHPDTFYIDPLNGNDTNNGFSPATAIMHLDTAISRSYGIGTYFLMNDYQFTNIQSRLINARIYPYGRDIRLKSDYRIIIYTNSALTFGSADSNHYFILDSLQNDFFINSNEHFTSLELNNVRITNSRNADNNMFTASKITLNNCTISNDSCGRELFSCENLTLNNSSISNNYIYNLFENAYSFNMHNTRITDNVFKDAIVLTPFNNIRYSVSANFESGRIAGNRITDTSFVNYFPANSITFENLGGIIALGSIDGISGQINIYMGSNFSIDTNNWFIADSAATITVADNYTANTVAKILPIYYNIYARNINELLFYEYYEGRPVLNGTRAQLAANYNKFSLVQCDTAATWYIHSDGRIYTSPQPAGIATAQAEEINMYPNPAYDVVNFSLKNGDANEIRIIDIYGKTVVNSSVSSNNFNINLRRLTKGIYFVQFLNNDKVTTTKKLIKR